MSDIYFDCVDANLGRCKPPPGYRIVWSETTEHYMWLHPESDTESVICSDKWDCYHGAWSHYMRALITRKQREGGRDE